MELLSVRPPVFPSVERPGPVHPSVRPIGRSVRPSFICTVGRSGPSICTFGRSVYLSAQSVLPSVRSVRCFSRTVGLPFRVVSPSVRLSIYQNFIDLCIPHIYTLCGSYLTYAIKLSLTTSHLQKKKNIIKCL